MDNITTVTMSDSVEYNDDALNDNVYGSFDVTGGRSRKGGVAAKTADKPQTKTAKKTTNEKQHGKKAHPHQDALDKLVNLYTKGITESKNPTCVIMYGPHGSGKDHLRKALSVAGEPLEDFAKGNYVLICREQMLLDYEPHKNDRQRCADQYKKAVSDNSPETQSCIDLQKKHGNEVWGPMFNKLYSMIKEKKLNFVYNVIGMGLHLLQQVIYPELSMSGYKFKFIYPYVSNSTLYSRVDKSAKETGYYNERAYTDRVATAAKENFSAIAPLFDELYIYNNENNKPVLLLTAIGKDASRKVTCALDKDILNDVDKSFVNELQKICQSKSGRGDEMEQMGGAHSDEFEIFGAGNYIENVNGGDGGDGGDGGNGCGCVGKCSCGKHGGDGCGCKRGGCSCGGNKNNVDNMIGGWRQITGGCSTCGGRKKIIYALLIVIVLIVIGLQFFKENIVYQWTMKGLLIIIIACELCGLLTNKNLL